MKINQWIPHASKNRYSKLPRELIEREVRVIAEHGAPNVARLESAAQNVDAMEQDMGVGRTTRVGRGAKRFGDVDDFTAITVLSGAPEKLAADFSGPTYTMTFAELIRSTASLGHGLIVIEDKYLFVEPALVQQLNKYGLPRPQKGADPGDLTGR